MNEKSRAVQFCSKMIYTVGPESRSVKQKMGDKTWIFKFPYSVEGSLVVKAAFVCTFKNEGAKYDLSVNNENRMVLSVRHASLLAIEVMNKITDICVSMNPPTVMLTPLCGAIFSRNDIPSMVKALRLNVSEVVRMLNSSCQSGGHYLKDSELAVAALASIVATSKLAAKGKNDERNQIITKVIKQCVPSSKQGYMYTVLDVLFIEINLQDIVINVVKVGKPEYNSELVNCSCGNRVPTPVRYQGEGNRFKLLVETSGQFGLDKVYRVSNSDTGFDQFTQQLLSDIICKFPLVVTSGLILVFEFLNKDGRRAAISRQCQGCSEVTTDD